MALDNLAKQRQPDERLAAAESEQSPIPLYQRVTRELTRRIEAGELPAGGQLPPEVQLARQFGVSRHTMRAGLDALVRAGVIERRRGRGTVVTRSTIQQSLQRFYSIEHEMRRRGAELRTQVLSRGRLGAGDQIAERACEALGIADPREVSCLLRLRFVDGAPLLLESLTFPAALCPALLEEPTAGASDPAARSFYDVLSESTGMRVTRAHEILRPAVATGYDARLLCVPVGTAVFEVERTTFAGETAVEWRRTMTRGDRYTYTVELVNPLDGDAYVLE